MAKGNFGNSFVEGLNPYLHSTSNLIARMIIQNARYDREDEQRQAELKQKKLEKEQSSQSLRNIIQGGRYQQELVPSIKEKTPSKFPMQNFGNKYETVNTTQETFKPMSALEKAIAYGGLQETDKKALDYYEKGNKPEKVKYKEFDGSLYQLKSDGSLGDVVKIKEKKPEEKKPEVISLGIKKDISIVDGKKHWVQYEKKGYIDPITKKEVITDLQPMGSMTIEKKTAGQWHINTNVKNQFDKLFNDLEREKILNNAGISKSEEINNKTVTNYDRAKEIYEGIVENSWNSEAQKWWLENVSNRTDKRKPEPYAIWVNLLKEFKEETKTQDKDLLTLGYLFEKFRAHYGFDPILKYGTDIQVEETEDE